jgi:LuxR family maltose regulon positive regulatory protein
VIGHAMADAEAVLAELDRIPAGSLDDTWQSVADWLRATSLSHLGRPAEALNVVNTAAGYASPLYAALVESAGLQARWLLGNIDDVLDELPSFTTRTAATGLTDFHAVMATTSSMVSAMVGRVDDAERYLDEARRTVKPQFPLIDVGLVIAEATLAVVSGDERRASRLLDEYIERSAPLGMGLPAFLQRCSLPLWYVLVPDSRRVWDDASLGPTFERARSLAQDLGAARATGRLPAGSPPLPPPGVTRALLALPWATELALAHIAARREAGWTLLDALWPQAQPEVRRHAADPKRPLGRAARLALGRLPVPPTSRLELALLGSVELRRDGALVDAPEWRRERVRSLLAHLVLHRQVSRERLAADLWPELDSDAQSRNLRVNLVHLLRVLEPGRAERDASFYVRAHGGVLKLHQSEWLDTDLWRFDELCRRGIEADGEGVPSVALDAMLAAVALWRGDPGELANEDWALPAVEERSRRVVGLAARAGELVLARGEPDTARRLGELALGIDPWFEDAHRVVISAYVAVDDRHGARRSLGRYRDALHELHLTPAEVARKLEQLDPVASLAG